MKFLLIFLIFVLKSRVFAIECTYSDIKYTQDRVIKSTYGCEVLKDLWNQTADIITGNHDKGKSDDDVKALFINAKSDWEFSPIYCKTFINLERIQIERVETVKREDFEHCRRTQHLMIIGTELWWLPEDVFQPLTNLRHLEISMNKIQYLPKDLIVTNYKLERVWFQDNKIQVVDLVFPTSLKEVKLDANQCIDRIVPSNEVKTIEEFNKVVAQKCGSSTARRVRELEWKIRNQICLPNEEEVGCGHRCDYASFAAFQSADSYKSWNVLLTCTCVFLIVGWAGTAFVLMKKLNDITHGDQHYLVSMNANNRQDYCED